MGDLVYGEVFANIPLQGFPYEGAFGGVELDLEGAVAQGRSEGGLVRDRLVQTGRGWIDLRGRGG